MVAPGQEVGHAWATGKSFCACNWDFEKALHARDVCSEHHKSSLQSTESALSEKNLSEGRDTKLTRSVGAYSNNQNHRTLNK